MSAATELSCDAGRCPERLLVRSTDGVRVLQATRQAGWIRRGGYDLCPDHQQWPAGPVDTEAVVR